ncbi:DsbA family oxidoreductase [Sulfitobacter albidus]|uniref:DsbA family oxidoreductase n=1 Tax=Sulfitobacter albidus TaxID=2829501 RepID=A0A975JG82_9RHOB|nr:DsbA family oxidoreductase [Sulfitobacter albidus]QUJ77949.1 DsbA family oxidoreductase [Sulfitobacter albidus]
MCPWCIIGFRQLEQALGATGVGARVRWHPFELNPNMPPEGQNLREHITEKYGIDAEQSAANRLQMSDLGQSLGITFNWGDDSRIVNSFAAHQLLDWSLEHGKQHPLKMALFAAHFTDGRDVSDPQTLVAIAGEVGLDKDAARRVLESGSHVDQVRERQTFWTSRGISGVPSMVFGGTYLVTGAQGAQAYAQLLKRVVAEQTAPAAQ